jgi:DnaJ like chaperone protein
MGLPCASDDYILCSPERKNLSFWVITLLKMGVMASLHREMDASMLDSRVLKVAGWLDVLSQRIVDGCLAVTDRVAELPEMISQVITGVSRTSVSAQASVDAVPQAQMEQTILSYTLAALAAKLVQVDGEEVHPREKTAYLAVFAMSGVGAVRMKALFSAACKDAAPVEQYARQIASLYAGLPQKKNDVLKRFIALAAADEPINMKEYDVLCVIAQALGFSSDYLAKEVDASDGPKSGSPWEILRIQKTATPEQVQQAYRERVKACHPDRWSVHQRYAVMRKLATEKSAVINAAYAALNRGKK